MLKLAEIFTDHMVLARDKKTYIWGESSEYSVEAVLDGKKIAETVFGEFELVLPPQPAGGPHRLEIVAGPENVALDDVWFGEVWLAGGQSNMEYLLCNDAEFEDAKKIADRPLLRQFSVPKANYKTHRKEHPEEFPNEPHWFVSTQDTCGQFCDLLFWKACKFIDEFKIPVGILYCNYGGSSTSAWVSRYTAATNPAVHEYVEDYENELKGVSFSDYIKRREEYYARDKAWHDKAEELIRTEGLDPKVAYSDPRIGPWPGWPPPNGPWHFGAPCHLYESMLTTIIPYTLTEVVWYQGEEDVPHSWRYKEALQAMIEEWRRDFRDKELPFILVQIAPYAYDGANPLKTESAVIRDADVILSHEMSGVSYVVSTDGGVKDDIHPTKKRVLGERVFIQSKCRIDGSKPLNSAEIADVKAGKTFEVIFNQPLKGNADIKGLQLVNSKGKTVMVPGKTDAKKPEQLLIECQNPEDVKEVRYAYADYIESNLYGENGLPVTPFRKLL